MNSWGLRIALWVFTIIILIQVFPGKRPDVTLVNPNDIHQEILIDAQVSQILKSACYDCHSNESRYPWYTDIVPVSWLIIHDINEGRSELNFSEWLNYSVKRKAHKLEEIVEVVESGEMPMKAYTILHAEARLTDEQINLITKWAKSTSGRYLE